MCFPSIFYHCLQRITFIFLVFYQWVKSLGESELCFPVGGLICEDAFALINHSWEVAKSLFTQSDVQTASHLCRLALLGVFELFRKSKGIDSFKVLFTGLFLFAILNEQVCIVLKLVCAVQICDLARFGWRGTWRLLLCLLLLLSTAAGTGRGHAWTSPSHVFRLIEGIFDLIVVHVADLCCGGPHHGGGHLWHARHERRSLAHVPLQLFIAHILKHLALLLHLLRWHICKHPWVKHWLFRVFLIIYNSLSCVRV